MFSTTELCAKIGHYSIPSPRKKGGGEDAFFISNMKFGINVIGGGRRTIMNAYNLENLKIKPTSFGVADGVGGWTQMGIDSGLFSNALMASCCSVAIYGKGSLSPLEIMSKAYKSLGSIMGTSTACVSVLNKNKFTCCNVGDSGFLIIRDKKILHRTKEQIHAFNTPYQLGTDSVDQPSDGEIFEIEAIVGDIIVMATDGIFDNLFDEEIVAQITNYIEDDIGWTQDALHTISREIVLEALRISRDPQKNTPFCRSAEKYGYRYRGGKMDDMTILVAHIS